VKSVVLISAVPLHVSELVDAYNGVGSIDLQSPKRLVVEGEWGWFAINLDEEIRFEYDVEELENILKHVGDPAFYQVEYSSILAVQMALGKLVAMRGIYIDNDQWEIVPLTRALLDNNQGLG